MILPERKNVHKRNKSDLKLIINARMVFFNPPSYPREKSSSSRILYLHALTISVPSIKRDRSTFGGTEGNAGNTKKGGIHSILLEVLGVGIVVPPCFYSQNNLSRDPSQVSLLQNRRGYTQCADVRLMSEEARALPGKR